MRKVAWIVGTLGTLPLLSACSLDVGRLQLNDQVEPLPGNFRELITTYLQTNEWEMISASRSVPGSSVFSERRPIVCVRRDKVVSAVLIEGGRVSGILPTGPGALCLA